MTSIEALFPCIRVNQDITFTLQTSKINLKKIKPILGYTIIAFAEMVMGEGNVFMWAKMMPGLYLLISPKLRTSSIFYERDSPVFYGEDLASEIIFKGGVNRL